MTVNVNSSSTGAVRLPAEPTSLVRLISRFGSYLFVNVPFELSSLATVPFPPVCVVV